MGTVYIHSNLVNDKAYVGQTWDIHQRDLDHQKLSDSVFSKAVQKYGWNGFVHYQSDEISSQEGLDNLERLWIILLGTTEFCLGYNRRFGGSRGRHLEATKQKLREARSKQPPISDEARAKISAANRGRGQKIGFRHSEETLQRLSEIRLGTKQSPEWIEKRVISSKITRCRNGKHPSPETCQKISESLKGNTHTLGFKHSEESKAKMSLARKGKKQDPEFVKRRIAARMLSLSKRRAE